MGIITTIYTRATKPTIGWFVLAGLLCLLAMLAVLFCLDTGIITVYYGLNSGITIGNWGGLEITGTPGFFRCDGQC